MEMKALLTTEKINETNPRREGFDIDGFIKDVFGIWLKRNNSLRICQRFVRSGYILSFVFFVESAQSKTLTFILLSCFNQF